MRLLPFLARCLFVAGAAAGGFYATGYTLDSATASKPRGEEGADAADAPRKVSLEHARPVTFDETIEAVGETRPIRSIDVHPEASGRVTGIGFSAGERVETGTTLLELDDAAEQAALASARATLEEARANTDRQRRLVESRAISDAVLQSSEAALLRAEADVETAEAVLAERVLTAPFGGVVGFTDLHVGSMVDPATLVTTLDDRSTIEVQFAVPERHYARIREGLTVRLDSNAYPDRTFEGEVTALDSRVSTTSRSLAVRALVPNSDDALVGGMFVNVSVVTDERTSPAIPEIAIIQEGTRQFVWMPSPDGAVRRPVKTGRTTGEGLIEIVEGLGEDDAVVVSHLHEMIEGLPIAAAAGPGEDDTVETAGRGS